MPLSRPWARVAVLLVTALCVDRAAEAQLRASMLAQGFAAPVAFIQDPSDRTVQYVVELGGRIRVLKAGVLRSADFLDLSSALVSGGEQGLLGLAFPPDYGASGRFYVNFTNRAGDTVVARFARSSGDPLVADPATRFDLQWSTGERVIRQPFANHNGGDLAFGPDGYLYIGMGDGGSGNDPANRAQDPPTLLGKMLRVDVGVPDADGKGFRVPPDNPFLRGQPAATLPEIWAFGLRNPWRYSFDNPAQGGTGAMLIGDVGQGVYEEIDYEPRGQGGRNYGWRLREGAHPNVSTLPAAFTPLVDPIFDYDHNVGVAVIGGFVYRGRALGPAYSGRYFYADLNGRVWSLGLAIDPSTGGAKVTDQIEHTTELGGATALGNITSFGVDADGELYLASLSGGKIIRILGADSDRDGVPDWWEREFGLDPNSAAGNDGAYGDPDGDGITNVEEYQAGTHPRGFFRRTFEGGAVSADFDTVFALFNPDPGRTAIVLLRYERVGQASSTRYLLLPPLARQTVNAEDAVARSSADVVTTVESDLTLVVRGFRRARPQESSRRREPGGPQS